MNAKLVAEHEALIQAVDKCLLVVAGPGRGKTTCVLRIASHAEAVGALAPGQRVLALTFARQAVFQIHDELRRQALAQSVASVLEIQTYDAFCLWLLTCYGRFLGLPRKVVPLSHLLLGAHDLSPALLAGAFSDGAEHLSFKQIASYAVQLLRQSPRLRSLLSQRYPLVIVDEYQDTDSIRAELVHLLGESSTLRLFADPDQHIYGFTGDVPPDRVELAKSSLNARVVRWTFPSLRTSNAELSTLHDALRRADLTEGDLLKQFPNLVGHYSGNDLGVRLKHLLRSFGRPPGMTVGILAWQNATVSQIVAALGQPTPKANWTVTTKCVSDDHLPWAHVLLDWVDWWQCRQEHSLRRGLAALLAKNTWSISGSTVSRIRGLLGSRAIREGDLQQLCAQLPAGAVSGALTTLLIPPPTSPALPACFDAVADRLIESTCAHFHRHVRNAQSWAVRSVSAGPPAPSINELSALAQRQELAAAAEQKRLAMRGIFAMTIHSAKGRQFDHTVIVLKHGAIGSSQWRENKSDCRNLIYVAATRSRSSTHMLLQRILV